ncbi:hypothetical protein PviCFBP13515_18300 [Pseudomonas viridiflava]|nr:hypothetical protein PviCFBP13507_22405 [Pseudomonas viridiflava]TKK24979.1 hypothetical protein PviCFBP13515_18300 [Pseudomonas viridiflava]
MIAPICVGSLEALRRIRERTRSVLGGIPTQSVGTIIIVFLQEDLCITPSAERRNDHHTILIVGMIRIGA